MSATLGTLFETPKDRAEAQAYAVLKGETTAADGLQPTARQRTILRELVNRLGASRAISAADLAKLIGVRDDREVRSAVKDLRELFGVPIGSSRDQTGGYFLITTKEELFDTVRPFLNQAKSELRLARMMCAPHELRELAGQLKFNVHEPLTDPLNQASEPTHAV